MTPKFLPTSLDAVSPTIDLETSINRVTGPGPHDYKLFKNYSDDSLRFEIEGKMMTLEEAGPHIKKRASEYAVSAGIVLDALRVGDLKAYVMRSVDSSFWQIPRFYFNRKTIENLALTPFAEWEPDTSGEDSSMYGNPVLVPERHFEHWLTTKQSKVPQSVRRQAEHLTRGQLPAQAPTSARRFEEYAHQAAEAVRSEGISAQRAFESIADQIAGKMPDIDRSNLPHAIRRSFALMYDKKGHPHEN